MTEYRTKFLLTALLALGIWLWWWLANPWLLGYHEQYQLFLFTGDYLCKTIALPGGVADYLSEFFTQFYYWPWLGGLAIALVLILMQVGMGLISQKGCEQPFQRLTNWLLSCLPSLYALLCMGDENLLLSYPVALALAIWLAWGLAQIQVKPIWLQVALPIALFPITYMMLGPTALIFVFLYLVYNRRWVGLAIGIACSALLLWIIGRYFYPQYPEGQIWLGINYYRTTNFHPDIIETQAALICLIPLIGMLRSKYTLVGTILLIVVGLWMLPWKYNKDKNEIFRYNQLVRECRWGDIIKYAEKHQPTNDLALQAVNLALARTGQLGNRMFEFPQRGINSLIGKYHRDNTSCLITAEAFWHLGMVNSAFRYTFDTQEAIMNDRKSGRFMKRMAECMIINGNYKVARKYIAPLKHSLFYRSWAKEAESYLGDEDRINKHPLWGNMRAIRYKEDMLYNYPEIDKMLGILVIQSQGLNLLAWDYYNAALLLNCNLPAFFSTYATGHDLFGMQSTPLNHQQALAMGWTMAHQNFDGIPYDISPDVQRQTAALAKAAMAHPNNPRMWQQAYPDSYGLYFLRKQRDAASAAHESESSREN